MISTNCRDTALVNITAAHIADSAPGDVENPVSRALADAFGAGSVSVRRGPSQQIIADFRVLPDAYPGSVTWNAVTGAGDIPLPPEVQTFLNAWQYGPKCRVQGRDYAEIVQPFAFDFAPPALFGGVARV